jgi:agmatinase
MNSKIPIGQGHGKPGRFAGLSDAYGLELVSEIVLLLVPFDKTSTYRRGSDKGPEALIEASRNLELYDIETNFEVYQRGIYTAPPIIAESSEQMLAKTYEQVKSFLEKEKFVVAIGGEHTISYGAIRACSEYHHPLTVLQFDAHADLQNSYEDNPWSHACVMARVKELPHVHQIVSVGIRSMSSEELINLDRTHTIFAHEMDTNDQWMNRVLEKLSDPVYITFDLDAFDSSLMPSTGTPEPGGLNWNQALKLLKRISQEKTIVGFDVVELCPNPYNTAPDYLAAKLIYKLLSYKFNSNKR